MDLKRNDKLQKCSMIAFLKQNNSKVDALTSRFFESFQDYPQRFPLDLCCGPHAFSKVFTAPYGLTHSLCCTSETGVSRETPSPFFLLKQEVSNLRTQIGSIEQQFKNIDESHQDQRANELSSHYTIQTRLAALTQELLRLQEKASKQKSLFDVAELKLKRWLVEILVESSQFKRKLESRDVMLSVSTQFGPTAFHSSRRQPLLFHALLKHGGTWLSKEKDGTPEKRLSRSSGRELLPHEFHKRLLMTINMLPPCSHICSVTPPFRVHMNLMELAIMKYLSSMKDKVCDSRLEQRYTDSLEKLRRTWVNYNALTKRHRRMCDESSSPYCHFPFLRQNRPIRLLNLLGQGGFAQVWEGIEVETLVVRAIKIIELNASLSQKNREFVLTSTFREVTLQRKLKHPHVVEMQECFEITPSIFVASLDLCDGGTLDDYTQHRGPVKEEQARLWIYQILRALEYIHTTGKVVHFDIKPTNILLHQEKIKISDFGLHQPVGLNGIASMDMTDYQNQIGTLWYMPPEHLYAIRMQRTSVFDGRFDVWSAGVVFYEMLYQRRPFATIMRLKDSTFIDIASSLYDDIVYEGLAFDNITNEVTPACKQFIQRLLQPLSTRPNAAEALCDTYFAESLVLPDINMLINKTTSSVQHD